VGIALPLLAQSNNRSADDLGYLQAAFALGGVLGFSLLGPRLRRRFNDLRVVTSALPLTAIGLAALPLSPSLYVQLAFSALVGAALAVYQVAAQANRLLATPPWFRGRMAALNVFLGQAGMVVGAWLAATSQGWLGAAGPFFAGAAVLLSIGAWLRMDRHVAGVLASDPAGVEGLYGRTHPSLFK
jgi:predicted MFS family arabinose efflux permease